MNKLSKTERVSYAIDTAPIPTLYMTRYCARKTNQPNSASLTLSCSTWSTCSTCSTCFCRIIFPHHETLSRVEPSNYFGTKKLYWHVMIDIRSNLQTIFNKKQGYIFCKILQILYYDRAGFGKKMIPRRRGEEMIEMHNIYPCKKVLLTRYDRHFWGSVNYQSWMHITLIVCIIRK